MNGKVCANNSDDREGTPYVMVKTNEDTHCIVTDQCICSLLLLLPFYLPISAFEGAQQVGEATARGGKYHGI